MVGKRVKSFFYREIVVIFARMMQETGIFDAF
jgi:hypothetical protein